jgi:hypothetical protein
MQFVLVVCWQRCGLLSAVKTRGQDLPHGTAQNKWLPELKRLVEVINVNFGRNFAEIGCVAMFREAASSVLEHECTGALVPTHS